MFTKVNGHLMLTDTTYSVGKKLVQVWIPAVSSLYFGLASIWHLPNSEQVVGTLAVVATFLGVSLGISSSSYDNSGAAFDGKMLVTPQEDGPTVFSLELDGDPDEMYEKDSITFKVAKVVPEVKAKPKKAVRKKA